MSATYLLGWAQYGRERSDHGASLKAKECIQPSRGTLLQSEGGARAEKSIGSGLKTFGKSQEMEHPNLAVEATCSTTALHGCMLRRCGVVRYRGSGRPKCSPSSVGCDPRRGVLHVKHLRPGSVPEQQMGKISAQHFEWAMKIKNSKSKYQL